MLSNGQGFKTNKCMQSKLATELSSVMSSYHNLQIIMSEDHMMECVMMYMLHLRRTWYKLFIIYLESMTALGSGGDSCKLIGFDSLLVS